MMMGERQPTGRGSGNSDLVLNDRSLARKTSQITDGGGSRASVGATSGHLPAPRRVALGQPVHQSASSTSPPDSCAIPSGAKWKLFHPRSRKPPELRPGSDRLPEGCRLAAFRPTSNANTSFPNRDRAAWAKWSRRTSMRRSRRIWCPEKVQPSSSLMQLRRRQPKQQVARRDEQQHSNDTTNLESVV